MDRIGNILSQSNGWAKDRKPLPGKPMRNYGDSSAEVPVNPQFPECPFPCYACEQPVRTPANCGRYRLRWPLLLRKANIPPIFNEAEKYLQMPPQGMENVYRMVQTYISDIRNYVREGYGLLLQGNVGTSKTTLCIATALWYLRLTCVDQLTDPFDASGAALQPTAYYFSSLDLANVLFRMERQERRLLEQKLETIPLLVWDDLGYEKPYDESGQANFLTVFVQALIEKRHKECRATLFTTNLSNSELKKIYNQGTIQRLAEKNHQIVLPGDSLRTRFSLPGF